MSPLSIISENDAGAVGFQNGPFIEMFTEDHLRRHDLADNFLRTRYQGIKLGFPALTCDINIPAVLKDDLSSKFRLLSSFQSFHLLWKHLCEAMRNANGDFWFSTSNNVPKYRTNIHKLFFFSLFFCYLVMLRLDVPCIIHVSEIPGVVIIYQILTLAIHDIPIKKYTARSARTIILPQEVGRSRCNQRDDDSTSNTRRPCWSVLANHQSISFFDHTTPRCRFKSTTGSLLPELFNKIAESLFVLHNQEKLACKHCHGLLGLKPSPHERRASRSGWDIIYLYKYKRVIFQYDLLFRF